MRKILFAVALLALAACGEETDDRPLTAQYLVPAIFKPSCATAACHSTATARSGLILDTIAGVCRASTLAERGPLTAFMVDGAKNRMPLDSPLPQPDIDLLLAWYFPGGDMADPPAGCP